MLETANNCSPKRLDIIFDFIKAFASKLFFKKYNFIVKKQQICPHYIKYFLKANYLSLNDVNTHHTLFHFGESLSDKIFDKIKTHMKILGQ